MSQDVNIKRYNHYVPRFYLKNFSGSSNYIGKCLVENGRMIRKSPLRSTAGKDYLYGEDGVIEDQLASCEGRWSEIIKEIIQKGELPNEEQSQTELRSFMVLSHARTLAKAEDIVNMWNQCHKLTLRLEGESGDTRASDKIRQGMDDVKTLPNESAFRQVEGIVALCADLKLMLIQNCSCADFITSDNPAISYNQLFVSRNYEVPYWYDHIGFQMFLPLSPRYCLVLFDPLIYQIRKYNGDIFKMHGENDVLAINTLIAGYARKELYFSESLSDDQIHRLLINRKRMPLSETTTVIKRGNLRFLVEAEPSIFTKLQFGIFKLKPSSHKVLLISDDGPARRATYGVASEYLPDDKIIYLGKSSRELLPEV